MSAILALFSSLLWGSADFFGGILSKRFKALAVAGVSQTFGLIFSIVIILFTIFIQGDVFLRPDFAWDGYLLPGFIAGISGFIGLTCFYAGLATGRMGVVSPISSLSVFIPLFYALLQGEKPSGLQGLGMAIAIAGAFCVSGPELRNGFPIKPLLLASGAAFGFGVALTFIAIGSARSSLMTTFSMRFASVALCLILAIRFRSIGGFTRREIPLLVFIGGADFLANLFLGIATTKGLVSIAMVYGSLFPIVTTLLAFKFLHERLHTVQYLGIILALLGVVTIALG